MKRSDIPLMVEAIMDLNQHLETITDEAEATSFAASIAYKHQVDQIELYDAYVTLSKRSDEPSRWQDLLAKLAEDGRSEMS